MDKAVESVKQSVKRTASNNSLRDKPGSEVVFYPNVDMCDGLEESVKEFVTSLFFVLEGSTDSPTHFSLNIMFTYITNKIFFF